MVAFDRVNRSALFYKLSVCGISTDFLMLSEICTAARVFVDGNMPEMFDKDVGVKQGWVMSLLLLALFSNDLHEILTGECERKGGLGAYVCE